MWVNALVHYALVAPCAIALAMRVGRLTPESVALCGLGLAVGLTLAIAGILDAIARPAGGSVHWLFLYRAPYTWVTVAHVLASTLVPVAWLHIIRRAAAARVARAESAREQLPRAE